MKLTENSVAPQNNSFDLAICCRIYPRISGRPIFGFTNKLALVQLSLESLKRALGNLKPKIWFLLDNCPLAYEAHIHTGFTNYSYDIICLEGEGNGATFRRQIELLSTQSEADLVYFAEDDYLYLNGALEQGVAFLRKHPEAEFLTLYDHADYYTKHVHKIRSQHITMNQHTWREVASTCLTFMARRETLMQTTKVFQTFATGNSDLGIWLALTKRGVINPCAFIRSMGDGLFVNASHALAWHHAWKHIVCGKRRKLWAPLPSLATHMESSGLSPGVDWKNIFDRRAENAESRIHIIHGASST